MKLWWLSFVDSAKPEGQQHLGCVITDGDMSFTQAVVTCMIKRCNPGGEVMGVEINPAPQEYIDAPRYSLLSKEALKRLGLIHEP